MRSLSSQRERPGGAPSLLFLVLWLCSPCVLCGEVRVPWNEGGLHGRLLCTGLAFNARRAATPDSDSDMTTTDNEQPTTGLAVRPWLACRWATWPGYFDPVFVVGSSDIGGVRGSRWRVVVGTLSRYSRIFTRGTCTCKRLPIFCPCFTSACNGNANLWSWRVPCVCCVVGLGIAVVEG